MEVGISLGFLLFFLIFGGIGIAGTILWIWMIVDCATNEPPEGNEKIVWILIIIFTHWIGALIYLIVRRPERQRRYGR
jgi:hypothetical protein